jgi:predicted ester cyclase
MSDTPTCAGNEAVVDRLWGEVFNGGRMEVLDELVATEFVNFDQLVHGPRFLAELIEAQRRAFPDMRFATIQTLADRDWVITRSRWSGSFREPFSFIGLAGVEPTGRLFDVNHVHAFRLSAGKVVEHWAVRDDLTMHTQLGVHPALGDADDREVRI